MSGAARDPATKDFMITLCKEAGEAMLEGLGGSLEITRKGAVDLVTEVDLALERMIVQAIHERYPDHGVLSEEGKEAEEAQGSAYMWLVDPLDGTTNYVHGYPVFCVSMALVHRGDVLSGVVYDPSRGELFHAEAGKGATLDDQRIAVSSTERLISSLLSTGFPYERAKVRDNNLAEFNELITRIQGVRRSGSVALDLASVAMGRLDGHWELHVKPWDTAAGGLLVREAGGRVSGEGGKAWSPFETCIVATNGKIHDALLDVLIEVQRRSRLSLPT
jgi:myo-inositol-1(or 4)-monophosphatase